MRRPGGGLVFIPLVVAALSVPLALGMIGPTGLYGFRTAASLASNIAWYAANRAAGWTGIFAGLIAFAANLYFSRQAGVDGPAPTMKMAGTIVAMVAVIVGAGFAALA